MCSVQIFSLITSMSSWWQYNRAGDFLLSRSFSKTDLPLHKLHSMFLHNLLHPPSTFPKPNFLFWTCLHTWNTPTECWSSPSLCISKKTARGIPEKELWRRHFWERPGVSRIRFLWLDSRLSPNKTTPLTPHSARLHFTCQAHISSWTHN